MFSSELIKKAISVVLSAFATSFFMISALTFPTIFIQPVDFLTSDYSSSSGWEAVGEMYAILALICALVYCFTNAIFTLLFVRRDRFKFFISVATPGLVVVGFVILYLFELL